VRKFAAHSALVLLLTLLGTTATHANSLVSTSPISGSTLSVSPTSVTVTGQLPLLADANEISVTDPNGVRVDDGTIMVNDVSATVGLRPLTESGFYTVSYILFAEADAPLEGKLIDLSIKHQHYCSRESNSTTYRVTHSCE
jgi:methionine-rich copper-binding protein CopC